MRFLLLQTHSQLGFDWESVLLTLAVCFSHYLYPPSTSGNARVHVQELGRFLIAYHPTGRL